MELESAMCQPCLLLFLSGPVIRKSVRKSRPLKWSWALSVSIRPRWLLWVLLKQFFWRESTPSNAQGALHLRIYSRWCSGNQIRCRWLNLWGPLPYLWYYWITPWNNCFRGKETIAMCVFGELNWVNWKNALDEDRSNTDRWGLKWELPLFHQVPNTGAFPVLDVVECPEKEPPKNILWAPLKALLRHLLAGWLRGLGNNSLTLGVQLMFCQKYWLTQGG